jgi:heme/copper-type cytochrome/quinol oxidase subunit 3
VTTTASSTSTLVGRISPRQFGVLILMGSMSVLFAATLIAYVWTRLGNPIWKTPEMPALPLGLLASTAMIAGMSGSMHLALRDVRQNKNESLLRALWLALGFGAAFMLAQALNWRTMAPGLNAPVPHPLYPFTFYMLTGVHAAHVVGGFIPLAITLVNARRRRYTSSAHEGLRLCGQYWDFLGAVWLILLATLWIAT